MLVKDGVAVGLATVVPDSADPAHRNVEAPPAGLAFSVTVLPLQIIPLFVGLATGVLCTDTDVVYTVEGLQPASDVPSVTVREYTAFVLGVAVGLADVAFEIARPLHANVVAPDAGLALNATVPPLHM